MDKKEFEMTVHLNNGNHLVIAFPKQADSENVLKLFDEAVARGIISVKLPDRGVAFPMCSVACIELSPPLPDSFPYLIEDARLVSSTLVPAKNNAAPSL